MIDLTNFDWGWMDEPSFVTVTTPGLGSMSLGNYHKEGMIKEIFTDNCYEKFYQIKEGDIITKVDGNQIISPSDLQERIGRLGPGDKVQLSYLRDGKTLTSDVTLKGEESVKTASNSSSVVTKNLGASFVPASEAIKKKYKISSGVLVTSVKAGGFFDQLDLVQGTIITTINGRPINKTDDIESAITAGRNNMATVNAISPDGMQIRYQFQVR